LVFHSSTIAMMHGPINIRSSVYVIPSVLDTKFHTCVKWQAIL